MAWPRPWWRRQRSRAAYGERDQVVAYMEEFEQVTRSVAPEYRGSQLSEAVRLCLWAGEMALAGRLAEESEVRVLRDRLQLLAAQAALSEARGEEGAEAAYADVAERWPAYGHPFEEAMARLGRARCLESAGRGSEAEADHRRASELAGLRVGPDDPLNPRAR